MDSIVNTHPARQPVNEITLDVLDPCVWRYVLNQDDLASFRLNARSDVIGMWEVEATTYHNYYCQVKVTITGCGFKSAISKSRKTHLGLQSIQGSVMINQTRILLLPPNLTMLTKEAFYHLKRDKMPQLRLIASHTISDLQTEALQFVGAGEGTDNLDFLVDLSVLKVIHPDTISKEPPSEAGGQRQRAHPHSYLS